MKINGIPVALERSQSRLWMFRRLCTCRSGLNYGATSMFLSKKISLNMTTYYRCPL
ncbi:hypothetical protein PROSTU_00720 [Providencia stuartii ATCC 25827]|uniref:Uncharacterized protein n=1 Tax=Providencia stuartii ATCC 25827 TaxID=471874 RepID=A0AA87CW14_PROST|nr:hypothetical protein PROSTU_00720 [Providencia stuartii ATCC 25827]